MPVTPAGSPGQASIGMRKWSGARSHDASFLEEDNLMVVR
jgi:hypothetical protein